MTIFSIFSVISIVLGQAFRLSKPTLTTDARKYHGLASNGITQIVAQDDSILWFATGGGLSMTTNFGDSIFSYYQNADSLPKGGISALAVLDSVVWIAGIYDTTTEVGEQITGGGLSYSLDFGTTWIHIPQPVDDRRDSLQLWDGDTVRFLPVTTPINNTTWDISLTDDYTYIVSWAGGLRRIAHSDTVWERIPLPSDEEDVIECGEKIPYEINPNDPPFGNHNHKGFSVLAYGDTVWVGTAGGINLGLVDTTTGCIRWRKYTAQNSAISGSWVVALGRQLYKGQETVWAVTLPAEGAGEYRAISKTSDGGLTWSTTLNGERAYNFTFHDSIVYVCTETGLFKSLDGENWALYEPIEDIQKSEFIFSHYVYSAYVDTREGQPYLWLGTADGVAKTHVDSASWRIYRTSFSTNLTSQPAIYAYPNPFSPTHHNILGGEGYVRVQYHLNSSASVRLEVYNFAMELVYRGNLHNRTAGDFSEVWNGRSKAGEHVANGTYFCKIIKRYNGSEKSHWTKLIVVK